MVDSVNALMLRLTLLRRKRLQVHHRMLHRLVEERAARRRLWVERDEERAVGEVLSVPAPVTAGRITENINRRENK